MDERDGLHGGDIYNEASGVRVAGVIVPGSIEWDNEVGD
jgi:hypothetical protein